MPPALKKQKTTSRQVVSTGPRRQSRVLRSIYLKGPMQFTISVRGTGYFTASAGGVIQQQRPTNDPSACTEFGQLSNLFDMYRVNEVKLTYYPKHNESWPQGGGGNFAPLYICYDVDSTTGPAAIDDVLQFDNHRVKNMMRPWTYKIKNIVQTDNSVNNAGMQVTVDPKYGTFLDIANVSNFQKGVIGWYGSGFYTLADYGDLVLDYYCDFYGRR